MRKFYIQRNVTGLHTAYSLSPPSCPYADFIPVQQTTKNRTLAETRKHIAWLSDVTYRHILRLYRKHIRLIEYYWNEGENKNELNFITYVVDILCDFFFLLFFFFFFFFFFVFLSFSDAACVPGPRSLVHGTLLSCVGRFECSTVQHF